MGRMVLPKHWSSLGSPAPSPSEDTWWCLETFRLSRLGQGSSWHLVGADQGCCSMPYNVQGGLPPIE